ncbi:MAG: hypothetical protein ACRDHL_06595, partial [Candidatus Promineifilaceae bacterium]
TVPLPGLVLTAALPYWEGARVMARYLLVGGIGFFLLAALGASRLPVLALRALAVGALLFEFDPQRDGRPALPAAHPPRL